MKKYTLLLITGAGYHEHEILALGVEVYDKHYSFYTKTDNKLESISKWPINNTVILKWENV